MLSDCHTHNLDSSVGIISVTPDYTNFKDDKSYSCGLHPWNTSEDFNSDELIGLENLLINKQIIAIGEAGLDRLKGPPIEVQEKIFMRQIDLSESFGLPLIIHCVRATADLLRIKKNIAPKQPWILHGFRGNYMSAKQLCDSGFYISIGEKFNPQSIEAIPSDKLLVETDESSLSIEEIARSINPQALEISTYNLNNLLNK